jgi:hypothetical protein
MNSVEIKTVSVVKNEPTADYNNITVKAAIPRMIDFQPMQWFEDRPLELIIKFDHQSLPASIMIKQTAYPCESVGVLLQC